MMDSLSVSYGSPCPTVDEAAVSSFPTRSCGERKMSAEWKEVRRSFHGGACGAFLHMLHHVKLSRTAVRVFVIEFGSFLAIAGGFTSYLAGDKLVGNGGLLLGVAGIITAITPIVQGWLAGMREERKQKLERHAIVSRVHGNQFTIELMKAEVDELHKSVTFKRDLIERQQMLIEIMIRKIALIEGATGKESEDHGLAEMISEQNRRLMEHDISRGNVGSKKSSEAN